MKREILLTKADKYYVDNMRRILYGTAEDGVYDDFGLEVRPKWIDGEPAHTKYIEDVLEVYDLSKGELPITSLRPIKIDKAIGEILWIYRDGDNNLDNLLRIYGIKWWDFWDIGDRTIGPCYGWTIRQFDLFNQLINELAKELQQKSISRRHKIDLWQYESIYSIHGLDPCAFMTDWSLSKTGDGERKLNLTLTQRSNDYVAAGHINKIQYVALQMMVARHIGVEVGKFCHIIKNLHIYDRHFEIAEELLSRADQQYTAPELILAEDAPSLDVIMPKHFRLENYNPGEQIKNIPIAI